MASVVEVRELVGPHGAGTVEGLRTPDRGQISVLGLDPGRDRGELRQRMGVQLQDSEPPEQVRVGERFGCLVPSTGAVSGEPAADLAGPVKPESPSASARGHPGHTSSTGPVRLGPFCMVVTTCTPWCADCHNHTLAARHAAPRRGRRDRHRQRGHRGHVGTRRPRHRRRAAASEHPWAPGAARPRRPVGNGSIPVPSPMYLGSG
jgi:hypothetical protein